MKRKKWRLLLTALTILLAGTCIYAEPMSTKAEHVVFTARTLVQGSRGNDVRELQGRLKLLGYYHGNTDGVFGWSTYWAVRNFQYRFGMKVDGRAGVTTQNKLVAASRGYNPWHSATAPHATATHTHSARQTAWPHPSTATSGRMSTMSANVGGHNVSENDMRLLANAVYGEARGEPFIGQVAIAAVILNRLDNPHFPHTVPSIIFQPGAFTATQDGQIYLTPNAEAMKAVHEAVAGWDPSDGAIYYFNPATATSRWIWGRPQIKRIGHHIFCR